MNSSEKATRRQALGAIGRAVAGLAVAFPVGIGLALVKGLVQYRTQVNATRSSLALEDAFRELESRGRDLLAQALRDQPCQHHLK